VFLLRSGFQRTRILDVDLASPLPDAWETPGYPRALALLRWRGQPIGAVEASCDPRGLLTADALRAAIAEHIGLSGTIAAHAVRRWLHGPETAPAGPPPSWSVVVCTRDRADDLRRCLASLVALELPAGAAGEVVVVDNASSTDDTRRVVEEAATGTATGAPPIPIRYVREERPGLNWARARGARVATGDVVAYIDDDVVASPEWIARLLVPFADSHVGAVTGLAMPLELETEAQWLFERYGGFSRGFERRVYEASMMQPANAGVTGAGANMAFRRDIVVAGRLFEVELDAGTVTRTGGDTWALSRVLDDGHRVAYLPDALVWHRHRRDRESLRRTLHGYSVGGFAYLTRRLVERRDIDAIKVAVRWLRGDHVVQLARLLLRRPRALPRDLVIPYWLGVLEGPIAYFRSRGRERRYRALDEAAAPAVDAPARDARELAL
jgi:glycosyltransferase involved in cell wall biosynthesis